MQTFIRACGGVWLFLFKMINARIPLPYPETEILALIANTL